MKTVSQCLQESDIEDLLTGNVATSQSERWEEHVSSCDVCRVTLASRVGDQQWWHEAERSLQGEIIAEERHRCVDATDDRESTDELLKLLGPTDYPRMLGRIGTYEVLGVLGRGGMGIVFKAFDAPLNRYVAIKMLLPHLAASGAARKRFEREGQAAAAVIDDHVLPIYAVSQWQNIPYLVMQYSSGKNLQRRIDDDGPLDVKEILRIGMQAARGLAAAHAQGLVHRDVKPSNILLDGSVERVMLTDFGLARAVDDASITRTGTIAGTPQYMSPEQARGKSVDARSDLFSLGCVLYTMSAGRPPFRAESSYAILRLITDEEPRPLQEINPDIPDWLCAIIGKLMSKHAEDRYTSADEVAELLEDCLAHVQQPATKPLPAGVQALAAKALPSCTSTRTNRLKAGFQQIPPIGKFIAAAAFAFSLIFAGVVIVLELNKGTLTIESDVDDIPIRIMRGDEIVEELKVSQGRKSTRVSVGNYVVEIDGKFSGIAVEGGGNVTLERRGSAVVKITTDKTIGNSKTAAELRADLMYVWMQREMIWRDASPEDPKVQELDRQIAAIGELLRAKEVGVVSKLRASSGAIHLDKPPQEETPPFVGFREYWQNLTGMRVGGNNPGYIQNNTKLRGGLWIGEVAPGSPAALAGLTSRDALVGIGPWEILSKSDLRFVDRQLRMGKLETTNLKVHIFRIGEGVLSGHFTLDAKKIADIGTLVLSSKIQPVDLSELRFGRGENPGMPRAVFESTVVKPADTINDLSIEVIDTVLTLGDGIEEVGLIVGVVPPQTGPEPPFPELFLVQASGVRKIETNPTRFSQSVSQVGYPQRSDQFFGGGFRYYAMSFSTEKKTSATLKMMAGSAHVYVMDIVGLANEQVRRSILEHDNSEPWLPAGIPMDQQSTWVARLMNLDGWEKKSDLIHTHGVDHEFNLKPGETRTVSIVGPGDEEIVSDTLSLEPALVDGRVSQLRFDTPEALMKYAVDCQKRGDVAGWLACRSDDAVKQLAMSYLMTATTLLQQFKSSPTAARSADSVKQAEKLKGLIDEELGSVEAKATLSALMQAVTELAQSTDGDLEKIVNATTSSPLVQMLALTTAQRLEDPRRFIVRFIALDESADVAQELERDNYDYTIEHDGDTATAIFKSDGNEIGLIKTPAGWLIHAPFGLKNAP
jgi:serine/threonine protein kinase